MSTSLRAAAKTASVAVPAPFSPEESLALALDPTTPPATLNAVYRAWANEGGGRPSAREGAGGIASSAAGVTDDRLGDALASNPNTPPDVLAFLATSRTAAFSRNPVAPLLLLEVPDFVDRMARFPIPALLRHAAAPAALVEAVANQVAEPGLREEASLHVALAGEVADDEWRDELRAMFVDRVLHGSDMQSGYARKLLAGMLKVGLAPAWLAVGNVAAGEGKVEAWGDGEDLRPRLLKASLAHDSVPPLCRCLGLADAATAPEILEPRSRSLTWLDRLGVALNPRSGELPGVLDALADDGNRYVRAAARARLRGEKAGL